MLFRSSVALLLLLSFASINAKPFDRRAPAEQNPPGPDNSAPSTGSAPPGKADFATFSKVIECAIKEMDKPAVALQGSNAAEDEPTPAVIAFDKCCKQYYQSSSPAGPPDTAPPDTAPPDTAPPDTAPPGTAPPGTAPPGTAPPGTTPPSKGAL